MRRILEQEVVVLPGDYFPWLAVTLPCYCLLTQAVKRRNIRRFGNWRGRRGER